MAKRKDFDIEIREELSRTVTVKAETLGDAINRNGSVQKRQSCGLLSYRGRSKGIYQRTGRK